MVLDTASLRIHLDTLQDGKVNHFDCTWYVMPEEHRLTELICTLVGGLNLRPLVDASYNKGRKSPIRWLLSLYSFWQRRMIWIYCHMVHRDHESESKPIHFPEKPINEHGFQPSSCQSTDQEIDMNCNLYQHGTNLESSEPRE